MVLFRILACLAPPAAGLGGVAALALTAGRPVRRRLVVSLSVLGAVLGVLALGAVPAAFEGYAAAALLTAAFVALLSGFFLLAESLRVPPFLGQLAAGLLTSALVGSVFLFAPYLKHAEATGRSMEEISRDVTRALEVNPFMTLGYSVFRRDLLRTRTFYPLGLESYPFAPPRWERTALGYALAGWLGFAAGIGIRALRAALRRRPPSPGGAS